MAEQPVTVAGCAIAQLDLEVPIAAPADRVWQALVRDTAAWWRSDFYCLPNPREFILEAKAGGRGYEFNGEGAELLWFTVLAVEPPHALELVGHLTPRFGGPALTLMRWEVTPVGEGSIFRLTESLVGKVSADGAEKMREGWRLLFAEGLKPFVEGRTT